MDLQKVHVLAPAKVNLSLTVEPPRHDGMHPITSKMASISLFDEIEITRLDGHALSRYAIVWHDEAIKKTEIDWSVTSDLAVRAHRLLEESVGRSLPVQMKLEKRIPVNSGLGGGSADAAAMLKATSSMFDLDVNLHQIALRIGSDVPFFLKGGIGMVSGVGELIDSLDYEEIHMVVVIPDYGCKTSEVYASFDTLNRNEKETIQNDLLPAACLVQEQLSVDLDAIRTISEQEVHLSGSGSTMFIICDNALHATTIADWIADKTNHIAMATQTYSPQKAMERT